MTDQDMKDKLAAELKLNEDVNEALKGEEVKEVKEEVKEEKVEAPSKIKVGDEEYTTDELARLVGLGKIGQEAEIKYNTRIDKVWPEFTKKSARLKELEDKESAKVTNPEITEEVRKQALIEAKNLGLLTVNDLQELGIVTKDKFQELYSVEKETEKAVKTFRKLEKQYNGADGRPKFVLDDILKYMEDNNIRSPEIAYKVKYVDQLANWGANKLTPKPGLKTQVIQGNKEPVDVRPNKDNLRDLIAESLRTE